MFYAISLPIFLVLSAIFGSSQIHAQNYPCSCSCTKFNSSDLQILLDIKSNISDDPFGALKGWSKNQPPCTNAWSAVSCDSKGHVTCIQLYANGLAGTIPSSIGGLKKLIFLSLWANILRGNVPSTIGNLLNLQGLYLGGNNLNGRIPDSLGNLVNLNELYLWGNRLTGVIPTSLGKLIKLTGFSLLENNLTGSIPTSLGNLKNVTYLYLHSNNLTGPIPAGFTALSRLTNLLLYNNYLTGPFPFKTCAFSHDFSSNCLPSGVSTQCYIGTQKSEKICSQFYKPPPLKRPPPRPRNPPSRPPPPPSRCKPCPSASTSSGTGQRNSVVAQIVSPTKPSCSDVTIHFSDAKALLDFRTSVNGGKINGLKEWTTSASCSSWPGVCCHDDGHVIAIDLQGYSLKGSISLDFKNLADLRYLDFSYNSFTGSIPLTLAQLPSIQHIDLSNNKLQGSIVSIFSSSSLTYLNLEGNFLNGRAVVLKPNGPFCPTKLKDVSGYYIKNNCLDVSSLGNNCNAIQRPSSACNNEL